MVGEVAALPTEGYETFFLISPAKITLFFDMKKFFDENVWWIEKKAVTLQPVNITYV